MIARFGRALALAVIALQIVLQLTLLFTYGRARAATFSSEEVAYQFLDHRPEIHRASPIFPLKIAHRFNGGSQRQEKFKVPLGTTEPSLFYGASVVPEGTESHVDTISLPLKRWAIFRKQEP